MAYALRTLKAINAAAEADMLKGNPITGAHHRAIEAKIAELYAALDNDAAPARDEEREAVMQECCALICEDCYNDVPVDEHLRHVHGGEFLRLCKASAIRLRIIEEADVASLRAAREKGGEE